MPSTPSNPSLVGFAALSPPVLAFVATRPRDLVSSPAAGIVQAAKFVPAAIRRQTRMLHYHIIAKRVQNFVGRPAIAFEDLRRYRSISELARVGQNSSPSTEVLDNPPS